MSDERIDYRRSRPASLQQLAAGGDRAAVRELERRGIAVSTTPDVTQLEADELRRLVKRWRDGVMPDERARNRAIAEQADAELWVRYRVDARLDDGRGPTPREPAPAPWAVPRAPRCVNWQRPTGSKLYPDVDDYARRNWREVDARRVR